MKFKTLITRIACSFILTCTCFCSSAHDIYFCGEKIPMNDKLVAEKLMNIIKKQMNYVNFSSLRENMNFYMPQIEQWLQVTNLPQDIKYLAIVESGLNTNASSQADAVGIWQLMKNTALDWNLTVNDLIDERKDFGKSTYAACQELARNYLKIRKDFGISSWVLTAAAYNVGLTRIKKAINRQGANYFTMNLNSETAAYVYKIIAVKELIEFPELYMQNFGYNVFNTAVSSNTKLTNKASDTDISAFSTIKVDVNEADGLHPNDLKKGLKKTTGNDVVEKTRDISAKVIGKYKNFKDGGSISIKLEDDLSMSNWFTAKGQILLGTGWIIDDRVMVDLGHGHNVTLFDKDNKKGISLRKLKNKQQVVLKVIDPGK